MSGEKEEVEADLFAELYGNDEEEGTKVGDEALAQGTSGGSELMIDVKKEQGEGGDAAAAAQEEEEDLSSSSEDMPEVVLQAEVVEQNLEASKAGAAGGMRMTGTQHRVLVRDDSVKVNNPVVPVAAAAPRPDPTASLDHPLAPITMAKLKHDSASSVYDYNFEDLEGEKPWLAPGANLSDFFNYGFDEDTWREYVKKQQDFRKGYSSGARITVVGGGASTGGTRRNRSRSPSRSKRSRRDRSPHRSGRRSPDVKRRR